MNNTLAYAISISIFSAVAATSSAIDLTFVGRSHGPDAHASVTILGTTESMSIDTLVFTDGVVNYKTICADFFSFVDGSAHNYSSTNTGSAGTPAGIARAGHIVSQYLPSVTSLEDAAALQLAVWDAIYTTDATFAGGSNFSVSNITGVSSSNVLSRAATFYGGRNGTGTATYFHTSADGGQSQLTAQAVPEPLTVGLLAFGLTGLVRKRKQI